MNMSRNLHCAGSVATLCVFLLLVGEEQFAFAKTTPRRRVESLPGYGAPPTAHYSGFIEVDESTGTHLFYYLIESASEDASKDPLVWWQNGGPGASSFAGLFTENGPFLLNGSKSLFPNPYSWNAGANLLYVEFPAGVGFSYCSNSSTGTSFCKQEDPSCSPCFSSDSTVVEQNSDLIQKLLGDDLFPEYKDRDLYLVGESYFGVYGPTLSKKLLDLPRDTGVNLVGLWATDPCTDNAKQYGYLDMDVKFALGKGLITQGVFDTITGECTLGRTRVGDRVRKVDSSTCRRAWRLYDMALAGIGDAVHPVGIPSLPMYIDPLSAYGFSGGEDIQGYLNAADVRASLHATQSPNSAYHIELGNNGYDQYHLEYAACNDAAEAGAPSMLDIYKKLAAGDAASSSLRRVIVSSGNLDGIVDFHGTEAAMDSIFDVQHGEARRPWFFNAAGALPSTLLYKPLQWGPFLHAKDGGAQVGGFVKGYDTPANVDFRFVTFRNSGHMVPAYVPMRALWVLSRALLAGEALSPTIDDADLESASDAEFYAYNSTGSKPGLFVDFVRKAMDMASQ